MRNKIFIRIVVLLIATFISLCGFSQQRLLTKKIVYEVDILKSRIDQTEKRDSIIYDYLVDKRAWWNSIDKIMLAIRNKQLYFRSFSGDTLSFDTIITNLKQKYLKFYKDSLRDNFLQKLFEDEIRAIKFEEEWTYNPETMFIDKKVKRFCPIIKRDTINLYGEDLEIKESFRFELGWIYPNKKPSIQDTICIVRNIHFNMPIYNKTPYHWWDSNLEAEYSIPYFESYMQKAEQGNIKVYAQPNSSENYTRQELLKRKQFDMKIQIEVLDAYGNYIQKDTTLKGNYSADNFDYLRFGDEWFFDNSSFGFIKIVNYLAPVIDIIGYDGTSRGLMPIYYIRRR